MKKWTIQVMYDFLDDKNRKRSDTSVFRIEAEDIFSAYKKADKAFKSVEGIKLGSIINGHYEAWPRESGLSLIE